MSTINAKTRNLKDILSGQYKIDYYQREYGWQQLQVLDLISDLTGKFLSEYKPSHNRQDVRKYSSYFFGDIILNTKDGSSFIVDGQQRLTTLTLLLIYLQNLQNELEIDKRDQVDLGVYISNKHFNEITFNLDFTEFEDGNDRNKCLEALVNNNQFDTDGCSISVVNLSDRYLDIRNNWPEGLKKKTLPYFIDWLLNYVLIVEITTDSLENAYTIFETMNDRGLRLSQTDMLKGYLLSKIGDNVKVKLATKHWRKLVSELIDCEADQDAACIKAWFRSQYAKKIRDNKVGAFPEDFDRIGTEFHRWLREKEKIVGLKSSKDYFNFINSEFTFYSQQFIKIFNASQEMTIGLEHIRYIDQFIPALTQMVLLSSLKPDDKSEIINKKINTSAKFIEILLMRRVWNGDNISYDHMKHIMFNITKDIRNFNLHKLGKYFKNYINNNREIKNFGDWSDFGLNRNVRIIKRILARMTEFVEVNSGMSSRYEEYLRGGSNKYEVEHIWPNKFSDFENEVDDINDFNLWRNCLGGLVLLPKSLNAGLGAKSYELKLRKYCSENLLASSLHPDCYKNNSRFTRFIRESGLSFKPYDSFRTDELQERWELYCDIANIIWNPDDLIDS